MVDLSADLGKDELHSLVFLLSGRLPRVKLESASVRVRADVLM